MRQDSFSEAGFEKYRKKTRKEQFLEEMDSIIPWKELTEVIEPFYPKPKGAGRRPIGIERMLRIHFRLNWVRTSRQLYPQFVRLETRYFFRSSANSLLRAAI